jgi:D-alanine-D-alanine ligase
MKIINKQSVVGVISGGFSKEREVSLRSGKNVFEALQRLDYKVKHLDPSLDNILESGIDIAFIALHGQYGEDGTIQSFLDAAGIPYTGSGPEASILGMNKLYSKQLLEKNGLPTPKYWFVEKGASLVFPDAYPAIIKPISEGSSMDVFIVDTEGDYKEKAAYMKGVYGCFMVEEYIVGKEVSVGVLEKPEGVSTLPILELRSRNRFYDYEAKYSEGFTRFILPAEIGGDVTKLCSQYAIRMHELLGCRGFSRIDMMLDENRGPMILELNSIPGMTSLSDLPAQAKCAGMTFDDLVETILKSSVC